jgi:WD40 repeat protein
MAVSTRRATRLIWVPLLLVAVLGLLALWGIWSFWGPARDDTPAQLASVPVPVQPNSLAWSADGGYLAAGTATDELGSGEVFVVDVAKASVAATLKATGWVQGLAFSPDGKWLAVANRQSAPPGPAPAELVVFDVPAFTPKLTARAGGAETGFIDLAWAADSKALHAIEGPADFVEGKPEIRRWNVPAFTEQPAIRVPQTLRGLAVSPDGRTLAVAEKAASNARLIRLFDLGQGTEQASFKIGDDNGTTPRLGFTPDGKAVGVYDGHQLALSWREVVTGLPTEPNPARFAIQPAGLGGDPSHSSLSPDGSRLARGYERHRDFGDLGWDNREKEFGAFVDLTEVAAAKTRVWRVGQAAYAPAVAFSPDGTRLAGTAWQPSGGAILIWAVPK